MSIAQDNRDGTKGASYSYRSKVLKGLQNVSDNTGDLTGLLNSILNAVRAHQEMEILLVRDPNNSDQIVQQIREYDEETETWSTEYYDISGAVYTPSVIGDLEYLDASAVLNLILSEIQDLNSKLNTLGQKASADSHPVVLSSEQEAILEAIQTAVEDIEVKINDNGQELKADSSPVVIATEQEVILEDTRTASEDIRGLLTGALRVPSVVVATANGATISGVKSASLWFRGRNGTLDGQPMPNGARVTFTPPKGNDTVDSVIFTVPTTGAQQIIITYLT